MASREPGDDAVTTAPVGRDFSSNLGFPLSHSYNYQVVKVRTLPVIPKYCYLFRLNESHPKITFEISWFFPFG